MQFEHVIEHGVIYMTLYTESTVDQSDYFADAFVFVKTLHVGYDVVMTFQSLQQMPFCLEKSSVRTEIFKCFKRISVRIWLE